MKIPLRNKTCRQVQIFTVLLTLSLFGVVMVVCEILVLLFSLTMTFFQTSISIEPGVEVEVTIADA